MRNKILSITLSILMLGSLCLTGCSSINNSEKDKANDITQLTTFSLDYSDGVDESTNFYFSVNLSNMDENIYDVYYTGSNGNYEGTLKDTDLVELIDILNEVEYLKIGENLPTETVEGNTSYISTMVVYTDGANTNNSIDRVVYSITNSEREKISEVYTVINQSTLLKDGITESVNDDINTDEDLNNIDEDKNIDKVASSYIEIQDTKIERHPEEEKNIDEAVTTIDEVEADEQGQLAANAGGSGEAEVYETGEEDVVVGKDPSLVDEEEKSETGYVIADSITVAGGTTDVNEAFPDTNSFELPSEEDNAWFDSKVDEYGTVLH